MFRHQFGSERWQLTMPEDSLDALYRSGHVSPRFPMPCCLVPRARCATPSALHVTHTGISQFLHHAVESEDSFGPYARRHFDRSGAPIATGVIRRDASIAGKFPRLCEVFRRHRWMLLGAGGMVVAMDRFEEGAVCQDLPAGRRQ
jgi:hypothetical protein